MFDQYDIGWKNQAGSRETRFGNREQLQRSIAVARACGLDVYLDVVMHQLSGSNGGDGVYRYLGADGVAGAGRFPKHPGCFRGNPPRRPEDPVPSPPDDFAFGDEFVYRNCDPPRYTIDGMVAFGDWLTRSLDVQGYRVDDTKGTWVGFVKEWMTSRAMASRFCVSEYFDGNPDTLNWWAQDQMGGRSAVYDFTLHWALQDMCDHGADMRTMDRPGYIARAPFGAVTFVDNPDTDLSPGEQIIGSKLLAYAFILTAEGYPAVYHKDYARGARLLRPQALDRQPGLDPRAPRQRHDGDALGRRPGDRARAPGLARASDRDQQRSVEPSQHHLPDLVPARHTAARLHRTAWRHLDRRAGPRELRRAEQRVRQRPILSVLLAHRSGQGPGPARPPGAAVVSSAHRISTFAGLANGKVVTLPRIYPAAHADVHAELSMDRHAWTDGTAVALEVGNAAGSVARHSWTASSGQGFDFKAGATGWHTLRLTASGLPEAAPFELDVRYTAPQTL